MAKEMYNQHIMHDPLALTFDHQVFKQYARALDDQIDEFLENKQLDEFNLRVFEKKLTKSVTGILSGNVYDIN